MKNKRQHHTAAWPFAAVYTNPAYAASLLQAAANSIGMPYCAQTLMHPQLSMIPTEASHQYEYHGYHRYMPYMPQMHRRNTAGMPSLPHPHILPMSSSPTETTFARLDSCLENDYFENSSSPSNSLSSIPDVEKVRFHFPLDHLNIVFPCRVAFIKIILSFFYLFPDVFSTRIALNSHKSNQKFKHHTTNDQIGQTQVVPTVQIGGIVNRLRCSRKMCTDISISLKLYKNKLFSHMNMLDVAIISLSISLFCYNKMLYL